MSKDFRFLKWGLESYRDSGKGDIERLKRFIEEVIRGHQRNEEFEFWDLLEEYNSCLLIIEMVEYLDFHGTLKKEDSETLKRLKADIRRALLAMN